MVSLGFSYAQLDFGFKPHWFSPLTDSSMLISTEAATMPSVSLSNWEPISRFGIQYELFIAKMSTSDHIFVDGKDARGNPRLAGIHLSMEPASGWSLGVNRLLQYGGPGRPSSLGDLFKSFFNPSRYDNTNPNLTVDQQFGNEQASITSSMAFPGKVPFEFYAEYAGEDTSRGKSYLLGNSALSVGIHFPSLWQRLDLTLESSEWQNTWYTHFVYRDGMTNYGQVIGNWFGDQRQFNDILMASAQTVAHPPEELLIEFPRCAQTHSEEGIGVGLRLIRAVDRMEQVGDPPGVEDDLREFGELPQLGRVFRHDDDVREIRGKVFSVGDDHSRIAVPHDLPRSPALLVRRRVRPARKSEPSGELLHGLLADPRLEYKTPTPVQFPCHRHPTSRRANILRSIGVSDHPKPPWR